ncbi:MAG: hypothetical protein WC815_16165 [Vicinamibacterales bacterium]|jgi:hypothetical protein
MQYRAAAVFVALLGVAAVRPAAQAPTLSAVLKNAAAYMAEFQLQLSGIVAEETYVQEAKQQGLFNPTGVLPRRILKSDLLLVKPDGADRYVEFRDVFEVDGQPVREREDRLTRLLRQPWSAASNQVGAIIDESARYNIGGIQRNVNTPVLALQFLDAAFQVRFEFKRATKEREQLDPKGATPAKPEETGVFRVSTEMWAVEYRERKKPTIIRTPAGRDLPARGRFWINPSTGAVLISELVIEGGGVNAIITVSYQSEPLMGLLVPVAMHESYVAERERVVGTATYGRFRQIGR